MVDSLLPSVRTPVAPSDLYAVLRAEWRAQVGSEPSRASLLVLLAHWDFETGGGGACIAYNLAGIKYTPGCGTDYASYITQEYIGGKPVTIHPPDPGCRFRAYGSLDEGAADYLKELRGQFGFAWPAVVAGDVADFAHRLKLRNYYTAPEATYARGLEARRLVLDARIGKDTDPDVASCLAELAGGDEEEPKGAA